MTARRRGFAHLHVHTVHSTLDAMTQHEEMCDEVLADAEATGAELAAIASTDHGTLSGTYKFSRMARKRGVTPLFGNEMYLANGLQEGARFAKDGLVVAADGAELDGDKADGGTGKRKTKRYEHITLLAETEEGWRNLIRINNAAQAPDAKWGKPRADIDLICRHSEGIIALTGCLGGPVLGSVARGDVDRARSVLRYMLTNGFDRDHLFLEIMEHGIPQEAKAMRTMLDLGDEFEISPVATNDAHFAAEGDAHAHEAWLCNATKAKFSDPDRWKFHGEGYWLRSAAEMRAIFDADERTQMACDNTLLIAERIAASGDIMTPSELRLPEFPVPSDYVPSTSAQRKGLTGSAAYLNDQIREGAIRRYGSPLPAEVRDRLTYEFDVIYSMGLGDYFLIVQDLIAAARREGIRVGPGRGSAAGCAISYCLDIVNIDPIRYNLLFERFLNPERIGMPDIDIDFESSGRDWAFGYLARRYGVERVARIGSFGVALSKGAIRAAARVLSAPTIGDDLSAAVPTNKNGKPQTFAEFMDPQNPSGDEFRRRVAQSDDHQAVAELAESWEGGIDKEGVHACGVIIGRDPLDGEVPLRDSKGFWVTQWDGKDLDALQFLKLDALALRNLDVVTAAERLIEQTTGERIDADNPSLDPNDVDPVAAERVRKTFELLQAGKTAGVFQLECVAGDTLVSGRKISEWFAKQEAGDPLRRTRSAYLNEGKWHFNEVIRIVKPGRSVTHRLVTATGRMIEATGGHMFMTEDGWKRLDQIAVGENLLVDTRAKQLIHRTCIDCGGWTNPDAHKASDRCYSCAASHHSNPSKPGSRTAISDAAKATYEAGREPWNKGLDKDGSPILEANGRKIAAALRGRTWEDLYGPERAAEFRRETSLRMSGENNHMFGTTPPHTNRGFREDLGHFVRSSWEADYARVLVHFKEPYEYEKRRFDVVLPDGTNTTYTPDFYLPNRDQYVEIKGFMRHKDRVKIAAFLEQYPDINFVLVDQVAFAEFEAANRHLVAGECPSVPRSACWEPVSQVLDAGEQDTYDIQMKAPAHNYLANGFVVHNSGGITELCVKVGPTTLDDIAAIVALYRPGPLEAQMEQRYALRKQGLETVDYGIFSPDRAEQAEIAKVLDETFGVPAYQEQLMRLGDVVAGFGPIERNRLQKAVSKKLQAEMAAVGELFISGAMAEVRDDDGTVTKMAFRRDTAEKVWAAIKGAGNYAFNASHSYAYGWVTYITAYLKANWPTQYGAALLSVTKKADKRHEMLLSLAAEGIEVVAPRINEAKVDTTVNAQGQVVIGMNEVRDVSREDAEIIVAARAAGPFTSLSDFAQRCLDPALENRVKIGAFEGLIEAGSFDEFGPEGRTCRMGMLLIARAVGQRTDLVPFDCEWNHLERARREARRLGVLVSPNPTKFLAEHIRGANIGGIKPSPLRRADEQKAGDEFTTAAIVSSWSEQQGHWGSRADILLTGTGAAVRATAWGKTLAKIRAIAEAKGGSPAPKVGDLVLVRGKIVMRKARLENENGEMVDGEAIAEETAEISVWDIRVVPVPGDHFDVPAGPSGTTEHWFVRPDGYVDPEPGPVPCGALDQVIVDGGLPFAAAAEAGGSESDLEAVPAAELLVEEVDGDLPNEPPVGPVEPVRPPDRFEVTAYTTPFGEALAMAPGVVEMPWAPGEVDTIVVEFANGTLGGTSGASAALRQKRPELAGFLTAVVRLQRRPASSTEDIATEIRPLVDEAVAGRPVEIVAYGAPIPRSTWVIPSADVPGVAAAAWAEMLAAPVEPSIELADALAHRPAA